MEHRDFNNKICLWLARTKSALPGNNYDERKNWSNGQSMNITETELYVTCKLVECHRGQNPMGKEAVDIGWIPEEG